MDNKMSKPVKVLFDLENDGDGYPPVAHELLNVSCLANGDYQIKNAPFFVRNISYHDVIRAKKSSIENQLEFIGVVKESTFTSISIIIFDQKLDVFLMELLDGLNCVIEFGEFKQYRILAVAIPETADYMKLRIQLEKLEDDDKMSFEELAVAH